MDNENDFSPDTSIFDYDPTFDSADNAQTQPDEVVPTPNMIPPANQPVQSSPMQQQITGANGLDKARQLFPQYSNIPDQVLGDTLYSKMYADKMSKEDFDKAFYPTPQPPSFLQSIETGVQYLNQAYGGLKAGLGVEADSEVLKQSGLDTVEEAQNKINKLQGSAIDWREIRTVGDLTTYAKNVLGIQAPQMAAIIGSGAIASALAGGAEASALIPPVGLPGIIAKVGAFAVGAGLASIPLFTGQNIVRQIQEKQDPDLKSAVGYAIPQAASEAVFAGVLGKLAGPAVEAVGESVSKGGLGFIKEGAKSIGEAVATGVPVEVIQQALERKAANLPAWIDNKDALKEYLDTAIQATVLSVPLGAGAHVLGHVGGGADGKDYSGELSKFETPVNNPDALKETPVSPVNLEGSNALSEGRSLVPIDAPYSPPNMAKAQDLSIKESVKFLKDNLGWTNDQIIPNLGNIQNIAKEAQLRRANRDVVFNYEPISVSPEGIAEKAPTKIPMTEQELEQVRIASQIGEEVAAEQRRNQIANERAQEQKSLMKDVERESEDRQAQDEKAVEEQLANTEEEQKALAAKKAQERSDLSQAAKGYLDLSEKQIAPSDASMLGLQRSVNDYVEAAPKGRIEPFEVQMHLKNSGLDFSLPAIKDALDNIIAAAPREVHPTTGISKVDIQTNEPLPIKGFLTKDPATGAYSRTPTYSPIQGKVRKQSTTEMASLSGLYKEGTNFNKIVSTPFTEQEKADLSTGIKQLETHLRSLAPGANLDFVRNVYDTNKGEFLGGFQFNNLIHVALSQDTLGDVIDSGYHEVYHYLVHELNVLNNKDKALLLKEAPRMIQFVADNMNLDKGDIQNLYDSGIVGKQEVEAFTFGLTMKNKFNLDKVPAKTVFQKLSNFMTKLKNGLTGAGFRTYEDLLNKIAGGAYTEEAKKAIYLDRLSFSQARYQQLYDAHLELRANKPSDEPLHLDDTFGNMEKFLRFFSSMPQKASKSPMYAKIVGTLDSIAQTRNKYQTNDQRLLDPLRNNKKQYTLMHEVLSHLRETSQPIKTDEAGNLIYRNKEGRIVALESNLSARTIQLHNIYRNKLLDFRKVARDRLTDYNIPNDSSPEAILQEITDKTKLYKTFEEKGIAEGIPEAALLKEQLSSLQSIYDTVNPIEDFIASNHVYVPFMRFGDVGIAVHKINTNKKGEPAGKDVVEFHTFESGALSGKYSDKDINSTLADLRSKYGNSKEYTISEPFTLTKNNIYNRLSDRMVTTELLSSLLAGSNETLHSEIANEVNKSMSMKGFARHFDKAEGIKGYSRDWERASITYLTNASNYLAQIEHGPTLARIDAQINNLRGNIREEARRYFDYATSPQGDMTSIRALNFLYAMGGNVSTAILNLVTLPTSTTSLMMQWDGNFIKHWKNLVSTLSLASGIAAKGTNLKYQEISSMFSNENLAGLIKSKRLSEDEAAALRKMSERGSMSENLLESFTGGSRWSTTQFGGKALRGLKTATGLLGFPIGLLETTSRISSALSIFRSLDTDERVAAAKKSYEKDERFKYWIEHLPEGIDERTGITMFSIQEAHAMFGKEGRGESQRGIWGSLVFPFMSYPQQTLELLMKQAFSRGSSGKGAALYTMSAYMMMAGMMGIPGAELWKGLIESYYKLFKGREIDLNNEVRKSLVETYGFDPKTALTFTNGVFRTGWNIDVARRIGIPLSFQGPLISLMQGNTDVSQFGGPTGGLLSSTQKLYKNIQEGDSPAGAFASAVAPVAFQNMWKGLVQYTGALGYGGAETAKGTRLANTQELSTGDIVARTFGFTPSVEATAREKLREEQLQKTGFQIGLQGFAERIADKTEKVINLRKDGIPDIDLIQQTLQEVRKERQNLYRWGKDNHVAMDNAFWSSFNESVLSRVQQRLNPAFKRPNKNVNAMEIKKVFSVK